MNSTTSSSPSLLGIAFVILKLTHVIAWSWLWVLAPFWIPLALVLVVFLVFGPVEPDLEAMSEEEHTNLIGPCHTGGKPVPDFVGRPDVYDDV